jgi:hypothetical protein
MLQDVVIRHWYYDTEPHPMLRCYGKKAKGGWPSDDPLDSLVRAILDACASLTTELQVLLVVLYSLPAFAESVRH